MKRRTIVGRCLPLFMFAVVAIAGGRGTSSAQGEDAKLFKRDAAAGQVTEQRAAGGQLSVTPSRQSSSPVQAAGVKSETSLLREIERRVLPAPIVKGANRYADLPDFYWAENQLLQQRLKRAQVSFNGKPMPKYRALTLVAGAAGVGKTFIKKEVFNKDCPRTATCKFDLRELYDEWARSGIAADRADLACGDFVVSRLKSVTDKSKPRLREYMESQHANFYVVDSLDEIHPDDYTWVLQQIADFVFDRNRQFVHVAVFGRGFAFRDFWKDRTSRSREDDIRLYLLTPPSYRTTGDLMVSNWNYHSWKYKLALAPNGGKADMMTLDTYMRWCQCGFRRDGIFRTVTCETNEDMRADVQKALLDLAGNSPVVCSALYNLAGNSLIREILREETLHRRPFNERRVTETYLNAWLIRESKVHDRPSAEEPEHLDLYLSLLRHAAAKYLQEGKLDDRGYFPVGGGDTVTVGFKEHQQTFSVRRILDGSGLIVTDPREEGIAKYRFEPVWVHRLLVETHNEQLAQGRQLSSGAGK